MNVKQLLERLGKEPLDAEVVMRDGWTDKVKPVAGANFAWVRDSLIQNQKVDDTTKSSVVLW